MRNYEQLIEYIINDEQEKAKALFHNLVVDKSRQIYNDLIAEEMEEEMSEAHGDEADDMMSDIEADHEGMDADMEHDDEMGDMDDMDHMDDMEDDDSGYATKDDVMDLESELENLKSQFEQLMADEANEPEHHDGIDDPDFDGMDDDMPQENMMYHEGIVREYVEKVAAPSNSEGQPVGAKNTSPSKTNMKSTVAGKNDMGGTTKNIARGGKNEDPDDKQYTEPSNEYSKGKGNLPGAGKFENVPGAKAGKAFANAKKPTSSEPSGVNKRSTID
jgi:hypothetical protein